MAKKPLILTLGFVLLSGGIVWAQQQSAPVIAAQDDKPGAFVFRFNDGGNFLGVQTEQVTKENQNKFNLAGEPRGVAVAGVTANGPAAKAGLMKGDVILRFDGENVGSVAKLHRLINESAPQHTARLTVSRSGAEQELSVTLGQREAFADNKFEDFVLTPSEGFGALQSEEWRKRADELGKQFEGFPRGDGGPSTVFFGGGRRLGVTTMPLTEQLADYFGVAGKQGLLVTSVIENSPAAKAGLKAGDVITEAGAAKVADAGALSRQLNRQQEGDVTLTLTRERKSRQITVTPEKTPTPKFNLPEIRSVAPVAALTLPRMNLRTPALPVLPRIGPVIAPRVKTLPVL